MIFTILSIIVSDTTNENNQKGPLSTDTLSEKLSNIDNVNLCIIKMTYDVRQIYLINSTIDYIDECNLKYLWICIGHFRLNYHGNRWQWVISDCRIRTLEICVSDHHQNYLVKLESYIRVIIVCLSLQS